MKPASIKQAGEAQDDVVVTRVQEMARIARCGFVVLLVGLLPAIAWLAFAPLASAVVAQGVVKVDLDRRPVQHAEGGTVREVKVRDGQRVGAGEPLIVLGDVAVDADVNRLSYRVLAERLGIARLEAEQSGAALLSVSPDLLQAALADPRLGQQLSKERSLFSDRREGLLGQTRLLRAQYEKIQAEVLALKAQIVQAQSSLQHQRVELERNQQLLSAGFISHTRIAQLEASISDYGVKLEERRSELARAEQRGIDTELRIKALTSDYRQRAGEQIKVAALRLSEIEQELRKASDSLQRQVIVSPAAGEVMNLRYAVAGAVVSPRETIAEIVPAQPRLVIEVQIAPEDVRRVQSGQLAHLRLTAYNTLTTPMVEGRVFYVSADRLFQPELQKAYYSVLVEASADALSRAGIAGLQAGMPVEAYIQGGERSALQYLAEPITGVLQRAGRER